jgi:hypothetical protein
MGLSGSAKDGLDGFVNAAVTGQLGFELLGAGGGEGVETDLAVGLGDAPIGGYPAFEKDLLERGVEGAFLDVKDFRGEGVYALRDGVSVEGSGFEDAKDQEDEGAGRHFGFRHR